MVKIPNLKLKMLCIFPFKILTRLVILPEINFLQTILPIIKEKNFLKLRFNQVLPIKVNGKIFIEMVMAFKFGLMVLNIKELGLIINHME
jgi:hypothetical protein